MSNIWSLKNCKNHYIKTASIITVKKGHIFLRHNILLICYRSFPFSTNSLNQFVQIIIITIFLTSFSCYKQKLNQVNIWSNSHTRQYLKWTSPYFFKAHCFDEKKFMIQLKFIVNQSYTLKAYFVYLSDVETNLGIWQTQNYILDIFFHWEYFWWH